MITLLYATVSGRAESLALAAAERLRSIGKRVEVHNVSHCPVHTLEGTRLALFVASSWGDGATPPDAIEFCRQLESPKLKFPQLTYAVLALGEGSEQKHVGCGWRIDMALESRGARRILPRWNCDRNSLVEFEVWLRTVEAVLTTPRLAQDRQLKLA